jgi:hypothetical protein
MMRQIQLRLWIVRSETIASCHSFLIRLLVGPYPRRSQSRVLDQRQLCTMSLGIQNPREFRSLGIQNSDSCVLSAVARGSDQY